VTIKGLKALSDDPSKQEEIDFLEAIATHATSKDTYLKSLFTDSLVHWVNSQIKNDFPPDIWGYYKESLSETIVAKSETVTVKKDLGDQIKSYEEDCKNLAAKVKELEGRIETQAMSIGSYQKQLENASVITNEVSVLTAQMVELAKDAWYNETKISADHIKGMVEKYDRTVSEKLSELAAHWDNEI
jgi:hypothetical protein